ncbi:MAG: hypothetical protein LBE24_04010 [Methylobacillus sp.]|jgi:hypothetical protein|nr:hypothetical protein [Methylobacillus sp.]
MSVKLYKHAFGGGEISRDMFGRIDDAKYQAGLALCKNFVVKPQGAVSNRPGFSFVREVKDSSKLTRVIPFTYSSTQTMVVEMGEGYMRFHTEGQTLMVDSMNVTPWDAGETYSQGDLVFDGGVTYYSRVSGQEGNLTSDTDCWYALPLTGEYEIPTPYQEADLMDIRYVQSADVVTLVNQNYPPMELRRAGANLWLLTVIRFSAVIDAPAASVDTGTPIQHSYRVQEICSWTDSKGGSGTNIGGLSAIVTVSNDLTVNGQLNRITFTQPKKSGKTYTVSGFVIPPKVTNTFIYRIYKLGTLGTYDLIGTTSAALFLDDGSIVPDINSHPGTPGNTSWTAPVATVTAVTNALGSGLTITPYTPANVDATTKVEMRYMVTALDSNGNESTPSVPLITTNNIYATGANNTLAWPAVTGAEQYQIYKLQGGLYGYIGRAVETTFIDNNIEPDMSMTPPIFDDPFLKTGDFPGAVSYFQQRRCFAGTINNPQSIWMTKSGTESTMSYSLPVRDDDRISFRVAAREANTIAHIVPLTELLLLTSAAEWRVSAGGGAITPVDISVTPQAYIGANGARPAIINNAVVYAAARGGHAREMAYNWQANGFITNDLCLRAPHLFDTLELLDIDLAKAPYPFLWFVSSSGKLLCLTYVPEQQVGAWHQHTTDGSFEACCVVAEGNEDRLYVVVKRKINGLEKRYIERLGTFIFDSHENACFVDSSLSYEGVPADHFTGLDHIEGKEVAILADGSVHPKRVVVNGEITLDRNYSKVHVGLPIDAEIETLPIAAQVDSAFGQGRTKNVNKIYLKVSRSSGVFAGPDREHLVEFKQRTDELPGTPPRLIDDEIQLVLHPTWGMSGQVVIRQGNPLPLSVMGLTAEIALGG